MYFDTSSVAKFYFREAESDRVRELVRNADTIHSSVRTVAERHFVLHRRVREGSASIDYDRPLAALFPKDAQAGLWNLVPVREGLRRRISALMVSAPQDVFLRAADAVHLTTAQELGESDIWTNDRHMLSAAVYFGLQGRAV